ncbi:MAG TPA: hypothetical protein VFB78_08475 [Acidimicrobiales bacterium]|nr:hypothetical protein [Acidimicrobiales bacterium]
MKNMDLDNAARRINLPSGDVDAVTARGATLARRRHRAVAGGLALSLTALSAGLYIRISHPKPVPLATTSNVAQRGDVPIRWEKVTSKSGLGFTTVMSEDALYAVSTGPGPARVEDTRRVVWKSDEGIDWSAVTELKGDLYVANLADRGGRLYGVGTGPANAAAAGRKPVPDLVVGASDDGGQNWNKQTLPVDVRAVSAKSRSVGVYAVDVATTKNAVVAIASLNADLDVPALVPAGQTAPNGWVITPSGVDVLGDGPRCPAGTTSAPPGQPDKRAIMQEQNPNQDPQREYPYECYTADGTPQPVTPQEARGVKASYTFAQLGVDGDLLRAVRSEPMVFVADLQSLRFTRVDAPALSQLDGPGMLERDGDGLLIIGQKAADVANRKAGDPVLLRSADGSTWTPATAPTGMAWAQAIGHLGDRIAIVGDTGNGPSLWVADGAGGWSATSLDGAVDPDVRQGAEVGLVSAAVGRLGVVAVVSVLPDRIAKQGGVTAVRDGYTLHIINDRWAGYVTDKSGKELAHNDNLMDSSASGALRGDGRSVTLFDDAGKVLVRFNGDDLKAAYTAVRGDDRIFPSYRVLATRDGLTWSDQAANDLAGEQVGNVLRVLMTGEKAIVAVTPVTADKAPSTKQIAIVGTPR